jgi:hypothetical protein
MPYGGWVSERIWQLRHFWQGKRANDIFKSYLNTCPKQGSRTIRTEVLPLSSSIFCYEIWSYAKKLGYIWYIFRRHFSYPFNTFKSPLADQNNQCRKVMPIQIQHWNLYTRELHGWSLLTEFWDLLSDGGEIVKRRGTVQWCKIWNVTLRLILLKGLLGLAIPMPMTDHGNMHVVAS